MYPHHLGAPPPPPRQGPTGLSAGAIVLLWIFVGWPLSWILLFLFAPLGLLFGIGITIWMVVALAMSSNGGGQVQQVIVNFGPPAPPPAVTAVRREVEGLAHINAVGGCGWCGSASAHVNDSGHPIHPRYWHAAEIEERIRAKTLRRGA